MKPYGLLFVFLSIVYHSNLRPIASGDSLPASLIPLSVVLDGSVTLDRFGPWIRGHVWYSTQVIHEKEGHWYSIYPIGGPVLLAPFYAPLALVPGIGQQPPGTLVAAARICEKIAAVALSAASAVLLMLLLRRFTDEGWAWILTLAYALGTGAWSTASQALWQHTFGEPAVIACLYFLGKRWLGWCGFCVACAIVIRPTNLILVPAVAAALLMTRAGAIAYFRVFAIPAIGAFLVAWYNYFAFANITGGYPARLIGRLTEGLAGILVSPGRGLLVYTPLVLFCFCVCLPAAKQNRRRHLATLTASAVFLLLQIAVTAKWETWWGGYCWGPRLLTELLAPAIVLIALGVPALVTYRLKPVFLGVTVYCIFMQALGVYFYPMGRWDHLPASVNDRPGRLWDWTDSPISRTWKAGPAHEPYALVWTACTKGIPAAAARLQQSGINPY